MKPYSEYKEIGLDFLDSLPAHWDIRKLKFLSLVNFSNVDKHSFEEEIPVRLCNYVDVYKNDFIKPDMEFMKATASKSEIEKFVLRKGDVLITKDSESWEDIAVPALVTENMDDVLCGYHLAQIRPSSISGNYLFWVLGSATLNDQYKVEAHGITRYGLGKDSIENSFIPFPSLPEQQVIADFLDRKTAQIDTLIEKKRQQIDLLQEQRTALINHAVTKGLNPNVAMKDSGVEWYGEIPQHWDMKRLGKVTSVIMDIDHKMPLAVEDGIPFLSAKDLLNDGTLNFENDIKKISEEDFQKLSRKVQPKRNDIIYSRIGARLGKARLVETDQKFLVSYSCCVVRVIEEMALPEYIRFIMDSEILLTEAKARTVGIGVPDLGLGEIAKFPIPLPPKPEQETILEFLNKNDAKIKTGIKDISKQTDLLNEYRTALISEAVTGKIDVRTVHERNHEFAN